MNNSDVPKTAASKRFPKLQVTEFVLPQSTRHSMNRIRMSDLRDGTLMEKINRRRSPKRPKLIFEDFDKDEAIDIGQLIESTLQSFEKKQIDSSKFGRQELR